MINLTCVVPQRLISFLFVFSNIKNSSLDPVHELDLYENSLILCKNFLLLIHSNILNVYKK